MKKSYLICILMFIILLLTSISIYAANTTLTLNGANSVNLSSTNKMVLQLNSSDSIGGVMGVIEKTSNISNIKVTAKNGWNIMSYNEETGNFNMVKNEGSKNEEIMEIEYTVSNSKGTGKIEIKDITVSEVENYDEEELDNVEKIVTIVENENPNDNPNDDPNDNPSDGEKQEKPSVDPGYKDDTSKHDEASNVESEKVKPIQSEVKQSLLPYTGVKEVIIPIVIVLLGGVSAFAYWGYRKYKGIK